MSEEENSKTNGATDPITFLERRSCDALPARELICIRKLKWSVFDFNMAAFFYCDARTTNSTMLTDWWCGGSLNESWLTQSQSTRGSMKMNLCSVKVWVVSPLPVWKRGVLNNWQHDRDNMKNTAHSLGQICLSKLEDVLCSLATRFLPSQFTF